MKRSASRLGFALVAGSLLPGCVVATTGDSDGNGGASFLLLLVPLALVVAFAVVTRVGRRRRRSTAMQASLPSAGMLRAELSVLADDILRFEPRVALCHEAGDDFDSATHRYRVAQAALDEAPAEIDLVRVQRLVDEANWSMARARAVIEGRRPPEPPPQLQRPGVHGEPAVRLDDDQRPIYVGSDASYRSGWFAAGGGLFGGLLVGTMLGGLGGWVVDEADGNGSAFDDLDGGSPDW